MSGPAVSSPMVLSPRGSPRLRPGRSAKAGALVIVSLAALLLTATISASAKKKNSQRDEASLHIRVHVVRAIHEPRRRPDPDTGNSPVAFHFPSNGLSVNVTEELRELSPTESLALKASPGSVLKTCTVVLR